MVIAYPITFNTIYFIIANNMNPKTESDTEGFLATSGLNNNSPNVTNINNEIWISIYQSTFYSDIFCIGI